MLSEIDVASLTGLFKTVPEEAQENDKLVDLFRNRAELKKEFASLRDEKYQLQDRVKQHEGATARVQQKMDHLENLLLDREWVHNVVAFYQLRRLAAHCNAKLSRFAEELKQQREQRIHSKTLNAWSKDRDRKIDAVEREIGEQRMQLQLLEDQLQAERHRLATRNGVTKLFGRQKHESDIEKILARIEDCQGRERQLYAEIDMLQDIEPPANEGLNVGTKRSINLMILSYQQQLYLHFAEDDLAALAKEASEKSVGAVNYGGKAECDTIIERIEKRWDSMENAGDFAETLKKRAALISRKAVYRRSDDVVPAPGAVATVFAIDANGVVKETDVNLLGDNYFGIAKVLSR